MAKYILLDDAMRIFSNVHTDNNVNPSVYRLIINDLNSLPSINPEDILAQVMLDLGLTLDLPIETRTIAGSTVFLVAGNSLVACFDEEVDFSIVDELAGLTPLKVVFRDSSFRSDADRINFETRFKKLSPDSDLRVI